MKRLLKLIFNRFTLVAVALILQIAFSICLPFMLSYFYPDIFGKVYSWVEITINIFALILLIYLINCNMIVEGKLTWAIVVLIFPIFGLVIYLIFVRHSPPVKYKKYYEKAKENIVKYQVKYDFEDKKLKEILGKYYGQFEYLYNISNMKTYSNTDTKYLKTGEIFFEELIKELNGAEKYIFMEYFIIERGEMWNKILNILLDKVKEGVEVRLIYDDMGTIRKLPSNYTKKLNKQGIKCVRFNSFVPILSAFHNNRDHRKITVVDGKVGFISGLNIADEYVNIKQKFGYWKDTGLKLRGEGVQSLLFMFLHIYDGQAQLVENIANLLPDYASIKTEGKGLVCPFGDGPSYAYPAYISENVYLNMINQAERYVWITTPYLIIDNKLTNALCTASKRGVDVRIITPHIPDKKIIFAITRFSYKTLQASGVKIFEFSKGFVHSKQVLCDDMLAVLGTINFDYRSLLHHYECGVLMYNTDSLMDMKRDFERMFSNSKNMKNFKQNALIRMICAILKLFTPML